MDNLRQVRSWSLRGIVESFGVPTIATDRVLARTTGLLYSSGGVLSLLSSLWFGEEDPVPMAPVRIGSTLAVVVGLLVALFGERYLPRWSYHLLVTAGTCLISLGVLLGDGGASSIAFAALYLYVVIDASFFFTAVGSVCHVAVAMAAGATSLFAVGAPAGVILMGQGSCLVVGVVAAWLARVADAAERDPLTRLLNRRGLTRRLESAIDRVARDRGALSVVLVDLDHFKRINESDGQAAGDRSLTTAAATWLQVLDASAVLSRFGGDTFALALPGWALGEAADLADELRSLVPLGLTASAGVAAWEPGDSASILLSRADVALFDAKCSGRDRTVVYGDPHRAARELESAVERGEMVLHFQPVAALPGNDVVGYEALIRWQHPRRGMVPPDSFIPQAERTGAIDALGAWALEEATRVAAEEPWMEGRSVSVNVSVRELRRRDYVRHVLDLLVRHQLPGDRLVLEITEAAFDDDHPQVISTLTALRAAGVRIAIDDFGVGYSSLGRLGTLPLDILKIDGSFVDAIEPGSSQAPLIEAIVSMGRALGAQVIAERVETEHQASVLEQLGCRLVQGYLIGRPSDAEAWQALV